MNSTKNDSYINAALKVFSQLGQLIEDDEELNKNHVLLYELPDDKDDKLLNILFVNYIPELKYIDPDIYNKYESNIKLDCIKEYIKKNKKFNKIHCHSF